MQSIRSILDDVSSIQQTSQDPDMRALAELVRQLALRLQDAEALAETNEMHLRELSPMMETS